VDVAPLVLARLEAPVHRIWIGLQKELVIGMLMFGLAVMVLYLHIWAFPILGFTRNIPVSQSTAAASSSAAPTR
jgi:hypothetical protein